MHCLWWPEMKEDWAVRMRVYVFRGKWKHCLLTKRFKSVLQKIHRLLYAIYSVYVYLKYSRRCSHRAFKWVNPIYVRTWGRVFIWKGLIGRVLYVTDKTVQYTTPYISSTLKICRVGLLYTELFYAIIPTLFLCFCWSAIPICRYIFNVFIVVHVFFWQQMHAWAQVLPSITEQQVFLHRLPMQYWLKNRPAHQLYF